MSSSTLDLLSLSLSNLAVDLGLFPIATLRYRQARRDGSLDGGIICSLCPH